ncbi:protocadherin beta-13 isoform X3 [Octopus bimaculoides]|nr:protocadherin beta-13 isoform X3 [Octopus bimaculoides]XP_014774840.1 protocadherin beta-13 isoform X3 [Octopus bimaculoides]|eukprot:XP_014774839.1 PREDICTED: protocadherin beta-13-like isoform X1 [Octopus bimaculoides]
MINHCCLATFFTSDMLMPLIFLMIFITSCLCVDVTYHVEEGKRSNTYIGDIDIDTHFVETFPVKGHISFSQIKHNSDIPQLFNVTKRGKLYTTQTLDAETLCSYNKECFKMLDVAVQREKFFIKILEIKVIIEDINDHRPEFPNRLIQLQFSEGDRKGMTKSIPNAIDSDVGLLNSQINYELIKNHDDPFSLALSKRVDGSYSLGITLENKLDREIQETYMLEVIAKDGGFPQNQGTLQVEISVGDINDNSPVFSQNLYNVTINNQHQLDRPIVMIVATDMDSGKNSKVQYYFSSKTSELVKTYFRLNEITGEIFLNEQYSQEKRKRFKLFIEARDEGSPPLSSIVVILVNIINQQNNAPTIDMNFFSESSGSTAMISEDIQVGNFIAYLKIIDNDIGENGEISCNLDSDKFQLQSRGIKKYKVVIKNRVDREIEKYINFTITCQDKGSPPLKTERKFSIQVIDVNDVQPQFTKDTFKFLTYENERPNFPVGFVNATDPDLGPGGHLTYTIFKSNRHFLPFEISNFGFISTTKLLDREQQEIYEFKVLVKDNGVPSLNDTAKVIVEIMDENDNAPYFIFPSVNPFSLDVHYHPQSKSDITTLRAADRDSRQNAFLKYELRGGNTKYLFAINPYTGVLSFSRPVHQNDAGSFELHLAVKDSGTPSLSATTTLSLTLTVSNTTAKLFTAIDTQSDNKIHINLFIIIIVAAVAVSVVLVVSITICIVKGSNNKNSKLRRGTNMSYRSSDDNHQTDLGEPMSFQYDVPVTTLSGEESKMQQLVSARRQMNPNRESLQTGIPWPATTEETSQICVQMNTGISSCEKAKERAICAPYHYSVMSTVSCAEGGCGLNEGNAAVYEEVKGAKICQPELLPTTGRRSLKQTLTRAKNTSGGTTRTSYKYKMGQNSHCNDIIDLKSSQVCSNDTNTKLQIWNLPTRNSFTSYSKPLPAVPIHHIPKS